MIIAHILHPQVPKYINKLQLQQWTNCQSPITKPLNCDFKSCDCCKYEEILKLSSTALCLQKKTVRKDRRGRALVLQAVC